MAPSRPRTHRGFSWSIRAARAREEQEHLLATAHDEEEHADSDGLYPPHCCWTSDNPDPPNPHRNLPVYKTIHRIRRDVINSIDDPYSLDQLKAPRMNISVVRPLVDQFYAMEDVSIVYCLLVNRAQFIREQSFATHHQTVNLTRALLCEIIAEKILRRFNESNPGPKGLLRLANVLVAGFEPFQNAPDEVIKENTHAMHWAIQKKAGRVENKLTALEVAIISDSKSFLSSSACQKVVDAIYRGKLVYTPTSFIDILPDHWKRRPISLYDPRRAPMLNQYRLIVPRTRNLIEVCQFVILLLLYLAVMAARESRMNTSYSILELVFDVYACGWVLDQFASILEHGWQVYSQNLWSFLDVTFSAIFGVYLILRIYAFNVVDDSASLQWARTSLDILSVGAPILIPRLAFNIMSENMLFVSLRAMMSDFLTLTALAVWSFAGFLLSMKWLHSGAHQSLTISKWMIWIWFGLDGTGIQRSPDFHWLLGPTLMILFAFLGNTLFLTVLVSMLSNTFSMIVANVVQEIQYRRAVLTFEGVKSDAIFAYMPPFNILALLIMLPLKLFVTPRTFHAVNVAAVRTLNFPVLLLIGWYERHTLWMADRHKHLRPRSVNWRGPGFPKPQGIGSWAKRMSFWNLSKFSVHGDIQAVFETEPPQNVLDQIAEEDDLEHAPVGIGQVLFDELHGGLQADRRDSKSKTGSSPGNSRRGSTTWSKEEREKMRRRKSKYITDLLREEFADSGDETEDSRDQPKGGRKTKRGERKDSIIDYTDPGGNSGGASMHEANARLHKLEEAMKRIETLLVQVVENSGNSGGEEGNDLDLQAETGIIE